jgi:DNA-repair protein XRCC3
MERLAQIHDALSEEGSLLLSTHIGSNANGSSKQPSISSMNHNPTSSSKSVLKSTFVQRCHSLTHLLEFCEKLADRIQTQNIRLIVIDSIAALCRGTDESETMSTNERTEIFFSLSACLRKLSSKYSIPVLIVNQVTDTFDSSLTPFYSVVSSGRRIQPALGLSWAHCIDVRIMFTRTSREENKLRREMHVIYASHIPQRSCEFEVCKTGVRGILGT